MIAFVAAAFADPSPDLDAERPPLPLEKVDRYEVLAINFDKGLAAVKVIGHSNNTSTEDSYLTPFDCHYPGMKAYPKSGVTLVLWDLNTGLIVEKWPVYAAALLEQDCSPTATNEANLAAAKARFTAAGLDLSKPPVTGKATKSGFQLPIGAGIAATVTSAEADNASGEGIDHTLTVATPAGPLWNVRWTNTSGYRYGSCTIDTAYVQDTRVVFDTECPFSGLRSYVQTTLALSPVFDLSPTP